MSQPILPQPDNFRESYESAYPLTEILQTATAGIPQVDKRSGLQVLIIALKRFIIVHALVMLSVVFLLSGEIAERPKDFGYI